MKVTALLVSHNGARWLPAVLAGVQRSTLQPDEFVAVDTGSTDGSVTLVREALGHEPVSCPAETPYGAAVAEGLKAAGPAEPDEWVWLLHDDSNPDPECLIFLEEAARSAPSRVAILGPKIREWPSLKRLLEVGVTISGSGQRETGLERGEYDQGQHDQQHDVLAVNTAGMLVRRDLLEQLGLDQALAVFGNDLDFGWRAARAGHTCQVVPDAVIFHAEAARNGRRESQLVEHPRRLERAGALYTLLANAPAATIPYRVLRMLVGSVARALGLLLVRAPGEAGDELLALSSVLGRPGRIFKARRVRRGDLVVPHKQVRPLLAPHWLPLRHGLDFVTDVGVAVADTIRDSVARRRPVGVRKETPWLLNLLRRPVTWVLLVSLTLAMVAGRNWLGGGALHGGALLPAPEGVGHWWHAWAASRHTLGTGTSEPGPAYLLPLATVATLFLGHAGLVIKLLFLLAVPLSLIGALRFLRRVADGTWAPLWGAFAYALLPVVSGAIQQGRLGTVAATVVLPWVATASLGLAARGPDAENRRWRAAWRTGLGVGMLVAFVPASWLLVALLALISLCTPRGRQLGRQSLVIVLLPLVLVLPWALSTEAVPGAWLVEAGKAAALSAHASFWQLVFGRAGGQGAAPAWLGIGLPLAAVAAFVRTDKRAAILRSWLVVASAAVLLALVSRTVLTLPGVPFEFRAWPGFFVVVVQAGFIVAAAIAAGGATKIVSTTSFSWRQPIAGVAFLAALLTPLFGAGWWVGQTDRGPVGTGPTSTLPAYLAEPPSNTNTDTNAVLVLRGDANTGIGYQLLRAGPLRIGDDAVLAMTDPNVRIRQLVERLLSQSRRDDAAQLAAYGVRYIYAPAPVSGVVSGGLDASSGLSGASAPARGARAWAVQTSPSVDSLNSDRAQWRPLWLTLQVLGLLVGIVLALPERKRR